MTLDREQRSLIRLALIAFTVSFIAGTLELFAEQAPFTPASLPLLPAPLAQLRRTALTIATSHVALGWLFPWLTQNKPARLLVAALWLGTLLTLAILSYCASQNVMGIQIYDPRPGAQTIFSVRATGLVILALCFVDVLRRAFFRGPASAPDATSEITERSSQDLLGQRGDADLSETIEPNETRA